MAKCFAANPKEWRGYGEWGEKRCFLSKAAPTFPFLFLLLSHRRTYSLGFLLTTTRSLQNSPKDPKSSTSSLTLEKSRFAHAASSCGDTGKGRHPCPGTGWLRVLHPWDRPRGTRLCKRWLREEMEDLDPVSCLIPLISDPWGGREDSSAPVRGELRPTTKQG